jgi:hypothetical protein
LRRNLEAERSLRRRGVVGLLIEAAVILKPSFSAPLRNGGAADRTGNRVANIIMCAGRMIDRVATTAGGSAFQ